jgi:tRNA A37 threonylcarbamoyladenosine modification protein TsaB
MNWLALDTATSRATVAVGSSAANAVEESLDGARQHARALLPMVTQVLERRGVTLAALDGVIVADGPGRTSTWSSAATVAWTSS